MKLMPDFIALTKNLLDIWEKVYTLDLQIEEIKRVVHPVVVETDTGKLRRRTRLHEKIDEHFDYEELNRLVFTMGYDPEMVLSGTTKTERSLELVMYCLRHNIEPRLIAALAEKRPFIEWESILRGAK